GVGAAGEAVERADRGAVQQHLEGLVVGVQTAALRRLEVHQEGARRQVDLLAGGGDHLQEEDLYALRRRRVGRREGAVVGGQAGGAGERPRRTGRGGGEGAEGDGGRLETRVAQLVHVDGDRRRRADDGRSVHRVDAHGGGEGAEGGV